MRNVERAAVGQLGAQAEGRYAGERLRAEVGGQRRPVAERRLLHPAVPIEPAEVGQRFVPQGLMQRPEGGVGALDRRQAGRRVARLKWNIGAVLYSWLSRLRVV